MHIGLIVYSHTGNTAAVAASIERALADTEHGVTIERVIPEDDKEQKPEKVRFKAKPDAGAYDALVFGSPVRGASLPPVMAAYMEQVGSLAGKPVAVYVTEYFPFPWMGGNRVIGQLRSAVAAKGGAVSFSGVVNWSSGKRAQMISAVAEGVRKLF